MDNVTHTLTGLFLSRAGLNRLTPSATPILLLSANSPDFDVISALGGAASYLHWHRNFTHSILFAPLLALAAVLLVKLFRRAVAFLPALLVAIVGVASHLLLDLTNIYGVRLLLPFSAEWFHLDFTPVIDFWIWGVFLICVAAPFLSKLVSSEIGSSRPGRPFPGRGFAVLALVFLLGYNLMRMTFHGRVIGALEAREYDNAAPLRTAAFPIGENPLLWQGLADTARAYHSYRISVFAPFDPAQGEPLAKAEASPKIDAAAGSPAFLVMREFAVYPLYRVSPATAEGLTRVELSDMRFPFTSVAFVDAANHVQKSTFQFGPQ